MKLWKNLTPEDKVSRSYAGAAVCFLVAIVIAVFMCVGVSNAKKLKERCITSTQGEVISVHPISKYNYQAYVYVSYTVDGKKYYTEGQYDSKNDIDSAYVPVCYDPDEPFDSFACDYPRTPQLAFWLVVYVIFVIGGCLFIWQGKTIKRKPDITDTEIINRMNKAGIIHIKAEGEPKNNDEECD